VLPASAEVVIVGGGVMGCSIAHQLTQRGLKDVLLLERGALCSGETALSGGFIQTHWSSLDEVRMIARSREWFQAHAEPCGYQQKGYLHVSGPEREAAVREVHDMLGAEGLPSEWLSPRELKRLQPLLRVDDLVGGAYEQVSGWADPVATTLFFAEQARAGGARLLEGVTVTQIAHRQNRVEGVETRQGFVSTRQVVLAAGAHSSGLHPLGAEPLPLQARRGQVTYMDRPGGLPRQEMGFYDEVTGLYHHPEGPVQLVGIDWEFDLLWTPGQCSRELDADYLAAARQALAHRFPSLAGSQLARGIVGIYDFTPDGHPIVDNRLGLQGYLLAAGFSGAGFKSSPVIGERVADMLVNGAAGPEFLRYARFKEGSIPQITGPAAEHSRQTP
jgi:sarcosine oxidase, subunit beta